MRIIRRNSLRRCVLVVVVSVLVLSAIMCSPVPVVLMKSSGLQTRDLDDYRSEVISAPSTGHDYEHSVSRDPQHEQPLSLPPHEKFLQPASAKNHSQNKPITLPQLPSLKSPSPSPEPPQQPKCRKPHCAEFLSRADEIRQRSCYNEIAKNHRGVPPKQLQSMVLENDCNFMNGGKRDPVALASAEGSGNTWIRGLLEKVTGICTGFNFCDYVMRMKGFIGDNINSGSVLVVKTHMDTPQWVGEAMKKPINKYEAKYGSGIFLMRNPYDSLIAEWNRRLTNDVLIKKKMPHNESHTNVAPAEIWYSNDWDKFFHIYMEAWLKRIRNWIVQQPPQHPVMVVKYEDLKEDTLREVERILTFLKLPFSREEVSEKLARDFTTFKRPHREGDNFKRYTDKQMASMKSTVMEAIQLIEDNDISDIVTLDEYLEKFE